MNIRQNLLEISIIVAVAALLGLFYNFFASPKPLPWIYTPRPVEQASDSALFSATPLQNDTIVQIAKSDANPAVKNDINVVAKSDTVAKKTSKLADEFSASTKTESQHSVPASSLKPLEVKYEQVLRLTKDSEVLFLDARAEHEYSEGHIPGSKSLPALEFEKHIPEIIALPRDKRIVVYCGGGLCELSHQLADNLIAFGFTRVFIYLGGWEDWKQQQRR